MAIRFSHLLFSKFLISASKSPSYSGNAAFKAGSSSVKSVTLTPLLTVGVNYNVFKHMGVRVEYRNHSFKTVDDTESLAGGQAYDLIGPIEIRGTVQKFVSIG